MSNEKGKAVVDDEWLLLTMVVTEKTIDLLEVFPQMSNLNPYMLLSSDTSGAFLTHIKLKIDNYINDCLLSLAP